MNHSRLIVLLLLIHSMAFAQNQKIPKDSIASQATWQAGIFGGISFPLGSYKTLPEKARPGFTAGLFVDRYFKESRLGIGVDIRYLQHRLSKFDSIHFANGSIYRSAYNGSGPVDKEHFSYTAFTVGPTYKIIDARKIEVEAFLRGGIVLQHFPVYLKTLSYTNGGGPATTFPVGQAINNKDQPSWAGLGGFRFTGKLSAAWGIFLQTDYIRTFGKAWSGDNNRFTYNYQTQLKPINSSTTITDPVTDGFFTNTAGFANTNAVNMQALNVTIGVKYTFGHRKYKQEAAPVPEVKVPVVVTKEIWIVVRDKFTGQVLEQVNVNVARSSKNYNSVTNVNGEAEKIKKAPEGNYTVTGVKNGVQATPLEITPEDFRNTSGPVIYREIFIADLRFVLKGITLGCDQGSKPLPGVTTALRNTKTNAVVNYVSDSSGKFVYLLDANADYTLVANQKGKFSQTELISTNGLNRSATLFVALNLKLCDIAKDKVFELKNILYDFDKDNIRPDAALILDNLVTILEQNPGLEIELSSHTDSRGKDLYNMDLSDRRAKSAVAYLISRGIERKRLQAKGYGETRLVNKCSNGVACTDEEHQQNRRTEVKVLKF